MKCVQLLSVTTYDHQSNSTIIDLTDVHFVHKMYINNCACQTLIPTVWHLGYLLTNLLWTGMHILLHKQQATSLTANKTWWFNVIWRAVQDCNIKVLSHWMQRRIHTLTHSPVWKTLPACMTLSVKRSLVWTQPSCNYNVDTWVTVQRTTSRLSINARHTTQRSTSYCCSLQQYGIYRPSTTPWSHYKIFNIIIFTPKCDIFKNYQKTVIRKYFIEHFN